MSGLPGWLGLGGLGLGAVWLTVPGAPTAGGTEFAQPIAVVVERLQDSEHRVEGTGLGSLTLRYGGATADGVLVDVRRAGSARTLSCRVTLDSVDAARTRTDVDCTPPQSNGGTAVRVGAGAFNLVVREHVAAAIDARDYDVDTVANQMIALVAVNGPALAGSMRPPEGGR